MEKHENSSNADALLTSIKKKEQEANKGNLKVYMGMAAGVGKTYTMLKNAIRLKESGVDVVVGYVEPHGRIETEVLLKELEIIPTKSFKYRGMTIHEMDIDAVLKRSPELVLVDELAHTNASGSRHKKRYQDILEIIEHGIDVDTTVNVQHLESIADNVTLITSIPIYETVPDSILENANETVLIDLSVQELIERLEEGKIYSKEQAKLAQENFFKVENLTALREIVLNVTSKLVDQDLQDYLKLENIQGTWKAGEKLLVAISPSPYSAHLIRFTRKLAFNLKASWIAVFVEQLENTLSEEGKKCLNANLELAKELGGEIFITKDEDVVSGILTIARQQSITQIIVGKPLKKKFFDFFKGGSVIDRLFKHCKEIDIHVVSHKFIKQDKEFNFFKKNNTRINLRQYLIALGSISVVAVLLMLLSVYIGYKVNAILFLFVVAILGLFIGRGPVLFAAFLSAFLWNFLFLPPVYTFYIHNFEDFLMFIMYFVVAIVTGSLTSKLKTKEKVLSIREERLMILYNFARDIGNSFSVNSIIETVINHFTGIFQGDISAILSFGEEKFLDPLKISTYELDDKELSVAFWAIRNKQNAGRNTNTLPDAKAQYIPIFSKSKILGVIGIKQNKDKYFSPEQQTLLTILMNQIGIALEGAKLEEIAQKNKIAIESEKLNKILLNSISHELRTPLTSIQAASNELSNPLNLDHKEIIRSLGDEIGEASVKLNRIVENLLDMSRIETGIMRLNQEWHDIDELIRDSVGRLKKEMLLYPIKIEIENSLPPVQFDYTLIQQVLFNLLLNVTIHTPPNTHVLIKAGKKQQMIFIAIEDNGNGISPEELDKVFDKFYRGIKAGKGGTGLGLAICKGIIEAHKGHIIAENLATGGARFVFYLPIENELGEKFE